MRDNRSRVFEYFPRDWLLAGVFYVKLKKHVSCEFNRSVDTQLFKIRDNRSRVFDYFPRDWLLAGVFHIKLNKHVSCEYNRSVDTQLCNLRDNRSRVFDYFPRDWLLAGDSPGCSQGRRDDTAYRLDSS